MRSGGIKLSDVGRYGAIWSLAFVKAYIMDSAPVLSNPENLLGFSTVIGFGLDPLWTLFVSNIESVVEYIGACEVAGTLVLP